jgi:hypothetical protein
MEGVLGNDNNEFFKSQMSITKTVSEIAMLGIRQFLWLASGNSKCSME